MKVVPSKPPTKYCTAAAAARLHAAGHHRVAYFGDQATIWTAGERLTGFLDVFPATAATPIRRGLSSVEAAEQAAREALAGPEPPTAFVSGQNLITIGIRRALQEAGLEAARLLFARLDGLEGPARHSVVPTRYIARGSGEIPAPAGAG